MAASADAPVSTIQVDATVDVSDDAFAASVEAARYPAFLRAVGLSLEEVAAKLLSSQYDADSNQWVTTSGRLHPIVAANCSTREIEPCAPCFESHEAFSLHDSPPPSAAGHSLGVTEIHQFVLHGSIAAHLNGELSRHGTDAHADGGGLRRSNVGGYHSDEETFSGSSSEWYGRLHNVLIEALRMVLTSPLPSGDATDHDDEPPPVSWAHAATMRMSGWINVSSARAFNTLHDHGEANLSLVYFVDNGENGAGEDGAPASADAHFAGALLLKTQVRPWASEYGFLPIAPRAGDLWVFPGYLAHAVMPRQLLRPDEVPAAAAVGEQLRISVACNAFEPAPRGASSDDRMRRLLQQDS